ncbi:Uncharacterised protein [Mycobacteroides abscessus subsp. abscessus]|nr:Uncharacterised protein [Mycobacteroides abscessus subsp. abscessus]
MTDAEVAVDEHQDHDDQEIPQELVQERRVDDRDDLAVRHSRDQAGVGLSRCVDALVDLEAPRDVGRPAVEFLVEVVAEAADGLGEQDRRRDGVGKRRQFDAHAPGADPRTEAAEQHGAPDAETAVPDLECVDRGFAAVTEVDLPVGEHVVDATTDQAERNRPDRDVENLARTPTTGNPPTVSPPHGDDDADDDA